jgi:hypothetical protein
MSLAKGPWLTALGGAVVVAVVAVVGSWARRPGPGCALDGAKIDPAYRVEVVDANGTRHGFCCVTCATLWLGRQPAPPRAVSVTDEASGEALDAADAWYVRSPVVTVHATGNRVHVYATRAAAQKHAATYGGTVLSGDEKPFHQ